MAGPTPRRRRHRRPHRPRQDLAGQGAHRHRHRPAARGEGARHHDRPRLRVPRGAGRPHDRDRRRARPRALRQEHAGRRGRHRPGAARDRRRRGRDAADARAPRHLLAAPHQGRAGRAHQDRHGRGRLARAGARRRRRGSWSRRSSPAARSCRCRRRRGRGSPSCAPRSRDLARGVPPKSIDQTARLPIDRVFTVKGFGTVVTGTLGSGQARGGRSRGDLPARAPVQGARAPGARPCGGGGAGRAAHRGEPAGRGARGHRARRRAGAAGALLPSVLVDATVELLEDAPRPLKTRDRVRFHVGTQEVMARVLLVGRAEPRPGRPARTGASGSRRRWSRCPATGS